MSDLRLALRSLRRSPATVALVVLTLGLGIAATTVIFSAVEGVLINPLRLADADRYVTVYRGAREHDTMITPTYELAELWDEATSFEYLEPGRWTQVMVTGLGPAEAVPGMKIRSAFARLLGMSPAMGRMFTPDELAEGGPDVVLLSHGFWREKFGRRDVVGEVIEVDGRGHEVVGVLPPGFLPPASLINEIGVWLPYRGAERAGGPTMTGKLKAGVTREQAQAELTSLMAGHPLAAAWEPRVVGVEAFIGAGTRGALELLMAAVAVLMLIATMNVANLLLGRSHRRSQETAIRAALGGSRGRIARQLLLESLVLGVAAGAAGILLASWGLSALQAFRPGSLDALDRVTLNSNVLLFAAALSMATSLIFGLAPALHAASGSARQSLRSGQRLDSGSVAARRFRLGIVVAEVALSVVLLVGAGLLVRTMGSLYQLDPGFQAEGLIRADLQLPRWKYGEADSRIALAAQIEDRLLAVPGVTDVAAASGAPPRTGIYFGSFQIEGREDATPSEATVLHGSAAGAGYFRVLGQPVLEGRGFTADEARTRADVFVVGRSTAAKYWGSESAVGSRIRLDDDIPWATVVGVAEDAAVHGLGTLEELQLYSPAHPADATTWVIRVERATGAVGAAVREAIHAVDLDLAVEVTPVTDDLRASVGRQRFITFLLLSFASVAVILAAVGFYGVLSHLVSQRRREIGIRMSLGADRRRILGMVVRQGGVAIVLGLAIGLPAAFAGSAVVDSQLHGIGRGDMPTYLLAALLLLGTGLLASWLPARKAAGVEPMEVIREE